MTLPDSGLSPAPPQALHSLVAWPPEVLDTWLRRTQERLGVRGFGLPHLNLRAPFRTPLGGPELVAAFRDVLRGEQAFEVRVRGWKRLPHVIFLECDLSPTLARLHARALSVGPSSRAPHDGPAYTPHLTLGLGILPWAEERLWEEVRRLTPPVDAFTVTALSLTREERGEVLELHTFPLENPEEAGQRVRVGRVGVSPPPSPPTRRPG